MLPEIIDKKQNLLDLEVIIASQELDYILNKYNSLLKNGK
ncbi:Spo0E family sporulation regulatory protein-aspartic acid phosphatase [Clostridium saccharobutylicum]